MFKNKIKALLLFKIDENIRVVKLGRYMKKTIKILLLYKINGWFFTRLDWALLLTLPYVHHIMVFIIAIYTSRSCDSFPCMWHEIFGISHLRSVLYPHSFYKSSSNLGHTGPRLQEYQTRKKSAFVPWIHFFIKITKPKFLHG